MATIPTNLFEEDKKRIGQRSGAGHDDHAANVNENNRELLEQIRSDGAIECFGGRLLRRKDQYGYEMLSFAVAGMSQLEASRADAAYVYFSRMNGLNFLTRYGSPEYVGDYTVFNFMIGRNVFSLRELYDGGSPYKVSAEEIMSQLVELLIEYCQYLKSEEMNYQSLCCMSMETVFVDGRGQLWLLPLQAYKEHYPIEIPREAAVSGGADVKSDLYAAAFVAVEASSGGPAGKVQMVEPKSTLVGNCLKSIRDWRPDLQVVAKGLEKGNPEAYVPSRDPFGNVSNPINKEPKRKETAASLIKGFAKRMRSPEEAETKKQTSSTWGNEDLDDPLGSDFMYKRRI